MYTACQFLIVLILSLLIVNPVCANFWDSAKRELVGSDDESRDSVSQGYEGEPSFSGEYYDDDSEGPLQNDEPGKGNIGDQSRAFDGETPGFGGRSSDYDESTRDFDAAPREFEAEYDDLESAGMSPLTIAGASIAGVAAVFGILMIVRKSRDSKKYRDEKNRSILASSPRESVLTL